MEAAASPAEVSGSAPTSPTSLPAGPSPTEDSADVRLRALEEKMATWKVAVAAQLSDATRKNKKVREELRSVRDEREAALSALRVQLTEEFHERTTMQRDEIADLTRQMAQLREEKKTMAAAHEAELTRTRVQLREVLQLEVAADYKRKEEQWGKEKAALLAREEAKESERVQADHECEVLKVRLGRLGAQYEELASLLQPKESEMNGDGVGNNDSTSTSPTQKSTAAIDGTLGEMGDATRQHTAMNATFTRQIDSIKAELQSKEQHTQFMLDRARQEHEAEKAQLLRELQLREEELKVSHTLLKQVQAESSGYLQRISHAQTERQALEQRYAGKIAALSADLSERMRSVDEVQSMNARLQEQLRTAQQQIAMLEEESTMREEAFHSLMLSEDNKRLVTDLQKALQAARDEASEWKMQYYAAQQQQQPATVVQRAEASNNNNNSRASSTSFLAGAGPSADVDAGGSGGGGSGHPTPRPQQAWQEQLTAKETRLNLQATQLEHKAHLLEAAEAKLNDMRRSLAGQASQLLQQQQQRKGRREQNSDDVVFREGDEDAAERDMLEASPVILTAASLLPTSLHNSLRTLEGHRRRLHLPGGCRCFSCFFSGGGASGAPLRLRRNPVLLALATLILLVLYISTRVIITDDGKSMPPSRVSAAGHATPSFVPLAPRS